MNGFEIAGWILAGIPAGLIVLLVLVAVCYGSFTWVRDFKLEDKKQAWRDFWKDGFQIGQLIFFVVLLAGLICFQIGSNIKKDVSPENFQIRDSANITWDVKATPEGLVIQSSEGLMVIEWDKIRENKNMLTIRVGGGKAKQNDCSVFIGIN